MRCYPYALIVITDHVLDTQVKMTTHWPPVIVYLFNLTYVITPTELITELIYLFVCENDHCNDHLCPAILLVLTLFHQISQIYVTIIVGCIIKVTYATTNNIVIAQLLVVTGPTASRPFINSYSASRDNWCTVGGNGGCRVGEVRAGTTSPMPDHKGFKLQ